MQISDYNSESIFAAGQNEYKAELSFGITQKNGQRDFMWNIIMWKRDTSGNRWIPLTRDFPDNTELVLTRLKTNIMMSLEKSFDRDFREFKQELLLSKS